MGINTAINNFEAELVDLVNRYQIPIACKKHVLANIYHEVEEATMKAIANEAASESKEETENALSEN